MLLCLQTFIPKLGRYMCETVDKGGQVGRETREILRWRRARRRNEWWSPAVPSIPSSSSSFFYSILGARRERSPLIVLHRSRRFWPMIDLALNSFLERQRKKRVGSSVQLFFLFSQASITYHNLLLSSLLLCLLFEVFLMNTGKQCSERNRGLWSGGKEQESVRGINVHQCFNVKFAADSASAAFCKAQNNSTATCSLSHHQTATDWPSFSSIQQRENQRIKQRKTVERITTWKKAKTPLAFVSLSKFLRNTKL